MRTILFALLISTRTLFGLNFPADSTIEMTISYLPDTTVYCDTCPIAGEIFDIHSRFMDDPAQYQSFSLLEVEFLLSRSDIGETFSDLTIFRDTLQTIVYTLPVNDIIDSSEVFPNWYKIIIPDSPPFIDYIEIKQPLNWPVFPLNPPDPSGHTLGFYDGIQQWDVTFDFPVKIKIRAVITGLSEETGVINSFNLQQNFPNPFNPLTVINYSIPEFSGVIIKVFDILGNEIAALVDEEKPAGSYQVTWNAEDMPSGVYFCQMKSIPFGEPAGSFTETKKMILMK
jgi:hypothetical protein